MKATLSISRFNPITDCAGYLKDYQLTLEPHETVLDALFKAWELDPGLSFRRSCRSSICGSCAMAIQGRPRLACQTLASELTGEGGAIVLGPLPGFRRIKDLVVDLDPFFEALKGVIPWLLTRPDHNGLVDPQEAHRVESPATCILCAICDAGIDPGGGVSPAALVKNTRLAMDPRDVLGADRLKFTGLTGDGLKSFRELLAGICPKKIELPGPAPE